MNKLGLNNYIQSCTQSYDFTLQFFLRCKANTFEGSVLNEIIPCIEVITLLFNIDNIQGVL